MARVVARRIVEMVPMLVLISIVAFGLLAAAPIDPARRALALAGAADQVDERDVEAKRIELGLDRPLPERYLRWTAGVTRFDLGESFVSKQPVAELIQARIVPSAVLAGVVLLVSVTVSIPLGVLSAARSGGAIDMAVRAFTVAGSSIPSFWLALLAMWLFSVQLGWFPALGSYTPRGMVLPAGVLILRTVGPLTRLTRSAVLETLHQDYVRTAIAKGVTSRRVVLRHALPNAMIPILTVVGLDFAGLLAHAAVVEWVFAWPGIGRMGVEAAFAGDVPVVLGFAVTVAVVVVAVNLVIDIGYTIADPRQRRAM